MKRRHVLALVASAALVLPAGGLWLWARHAENVLAAAQQRCRDAGLPMTIDDIRPPPVPDEDNAALVLAKLGPMLESLADDRDERSLFRVIGRLEEVGPEAFLTETQVAELETAFAAQPVTEALKLIEEMASKGGFDAELRYEQGVSMETRHWGRIRDSTKILQTGARLAGGRSASPDALAHIFRMISLAEFLRAEPLLISQLSRQAIIRNALAEFERLAGIDSAPVSVLEGAAEKLSVISLREDLCRAIDGERILINAHIYREARKSVSQVRGIADDGTFTARLVWLSYDFPGVLDLEEAESVVRMTRGRLAIARAERFDEIVRIIPPPEQIPRRLLLTVTGGIHLRLIASRTFQTEARLSAARIGLALDRYRAAHGVYPAALAELAPAFLPEVPQDFFSGKAFVYVRDADGLGALVYSVGPNMRDDGGVKDEPSAAGGATGTGDRDDESWACGAAAKRKFAPPAPAASASVPAP